VRTLARGPTLDQINPDHYKRNSMEVIDIIEAMLTPEEFRGFLKGNQLKYLSRCDHKPDSEGKLNPIEHLEKDSWYLDRLKDHYRKTWERNR